MKMEVLERLRALLQADRERAMSQDRSDGSMRQKVQEDEALLAYLDENLPEDAAAESDEDQVMVRVAPRWAWDVIDETLNMDCSSSAFDKSLREQISLAVGGMSMASEELGTGREMRTVSQDDVRDYIAEEFQ